MNILEMQIIDPHVRFRDDESTEAAAATAVVMKEISAAMPDLFRADHPFIFIIQQKDTGNILFMGKVMNPAE